MSADYARKLVDAVAVYDNIQKRYNCTDPDVVVKLPKTESVIRPLVSLAPEQQVTVWSKPGKEAKGQPTATYLAAI
jgi:hypothetical protein